MRARYRLSHFYQKYANADGIPVLSSKNPVDKTLVLACQLVREMVAERNDVRDALIKNRATFAIVAAVEQTTDIPEYSNLPDYYNTRARGLGGQVGLCAEESILCDRHRDRWRGESICVHEFSHTIALYGLYTADPTFEKRLADAYAAATSAGKWQSTYSAQNPQEYWAEAVQDWYDTNLQSIPANGVHGEIATQHALAAYDLPLYQLVDELLPEVTRWDDCYKQQP